MSESAAAGEALQPLVVATSKDADEAKRVREAFAAASVAYYERENLVLRERYAALEGKIKVDQQALSATQQALEDLDASIQQIQDAAAALRNEGGV